MLFDNPKLIGRTLNQRYRIQDPIASGGFGCTYKATDILHENQIVVVKWLRKIDSVRAKELFQQEAKILKDLGAHPQIPTLIDSFEENQQFYLVQEFIDGDTIKNEVEAIARNSNLQEREQKIFQLLKEILEVLEFVHNQNNENRQGEPIIHRDIKPDNIMRKRQDGKIVLIDFGAVKEIINNNSGISTSLIGTFGYMPPEQIEGHPRRYLKRSHRDLL